MLASTEARKADFATERMSGGAAELTEPDNKYGDVLANNSRKATAVRRFCRCCCVTTRPQGTCGRRRETELTKDGHAIKSFT